MCAFLMAFQRWLTTLIANMCTEWGTRQSLKCLCWRQLLVHFRSYSNKYFTGSVSTDTNVGPSSCSSSVMLNTEGMIVWFTGTTTTISALNRRLSLTCYGWFCTRKLHTSVHTHEKLFSFIFGRVISLVVSRVCLNSEIMQALLKRTDSEYLIHFVCIQLPVS